MFGNAVMKTSMTGFVHGGSLKRNHPTIHPPYGRVKKPRCVNEAFKMGVSDNLLRGVIRAALFFQKELFH